MHYKIGIVGLGSIGKRHLNNLHDVLQNRGSTCEIDVIKKNIYLPKSEILNKKINKVIPLFDELNEYYDVIFITNPTDMHYETIKRYVNSTKHMFIEKPIFHRTDLSIKKLHLKGDSHYYVACPLRYKKVIQYLKEHVNTQLVISVRVISSSYLPEWRPERDYRDTYSASKNQGGGVVNDLIHEWDYLKFLFGPPDKVSYFKGRYSNLKIESEDIAIYIAQYPTMLAEIHLDYFGRVAQRMIEMYTDEEVIVADLLKNEIHFLKANKKVVFEEDRNDYQKAELHHFFDLIEGNINNTNSIDAAVDTLKIATRGLS